MMTPALLASCACGCHTVEWYEILALFVGMGLGGALFFIGLAWAIRWEGRH